MKDMLKGLRAGAICQAGSLCREVLEQRQEGVEIFLDGGARVRRTQLYRDGRNLPVDSRQHAERAGSLIAQR